jgi:hypothetical protein
LLVPSSVITNVFYRSNVGPNIHSVVPVQPF